MDMLAMAYLFDLLSKNRPWDEDFEPRPPSRLKRFIKRLLSTFISKQPSPEACSDREDAGTPAQRLQMIEPRGFTGRTVSKRNVSMGCCGACASE